MDVEGNGPARDKYIPRSMDTGSRIETIGTAALPQQQQQQRISPRHNNNNQSQVRHPQHRNNSSEEIRRHSQEQQYYQQMAPQTIYDVRPSQTKQIPSPRAPAPPAQQPRRTPVTPPYGGYQLPSHHRSNSWNYPPPADVMNVGYGLSAAGNPLIPVLQDPGSESADYSGRRKRSFSDASAGRTTPPTPPSGAPQQQQPSPNNAGNWSPRGEIMGLAKGTRRTPPASPNRNVDAANYRTMSPRISPYSNLRPVHHGRNDNMHVTFSSGTPLDHPYSATASMRNLKPWEHNIEDMATETDGLLYADGPGGEDTVFDEQRRSKRSHHKMHMRQQSAQLFMEDVKGIPQRPACRDVLFVLLFLFHLVGMIFLGTAVTLSYRNVIYVACLCGAFAVLVSTCTLLIMMTITKRIVQVALILTISLSFAWGTIGIGVSPKNFVPVTGIIALALSVAYAFVVWDRIPFAAANLHAGLSAVRANLGTVLVALVFQGLALVWTIFYTFVLIGVYDALEVGDLTLSHNTTIFVYCMFGISYYWTFQVLMNVIQVTVSGTIGSWWFKPASSESSLWNQSVGHAFFSAILYSSGSICFGSLVIGPVHLIRQLSDFCRPAQEDSMLMCLHEFMNCVQQCIANCVDSLSDHFNPWALTYVGLYGYGLMEAGHNATELFEKRGWTKIVSDDLVINVLLMFSIVVGGVTGCFGMLIQQIDKLSFSNFDAPTLTAFSIGLGVGLVLTSVLFSIISSSVSAVIVCFAGSPLEFESHHPQLSAEMRSAWREVWPGCMDVVDLRVSFMTGGIQGVV